MTATRFAPLIALLILPAEPSKLAAADASLAPGPGALQPAWLLEVPDSAGDVLVADTGSATMYRFRNTAEGVTEVDRRYMSIGLNGAGKKRAWDRKTPLGVYFVTERLDTSKLDARYGIAAFPLDYPNTWDRLNSRTGYGIWLHGVDHRNPERPPFDTDGCLALPNDDLGRLLDVLTPLETPVIVARSMRWSESADVERLRIEFRRVLEAWRRSQETGDLLEYLSHYADEFRYRDMDLPGWSSYRMAVFEKRPLLSVTLSDMILVADPEEPDLFLSRFRQVLATDADSVKTRKRLYWRRYANGDWKIIAEDSG